MKQNLKVKTFVGTSENAIGTQIWTALLADDSINPPFILRGKEKCLSPLSPSFQLLPMKAKALLYFSLFSLPLLCQRVLAQSLSPASFSVGFRNMGISNVGSKGSKTLWAKVYYPATKAGASAPILPKAGGWPVVVFLHGYSGLGSNYPDLANRLAAMGFVMVMSDTARFSPDLQLDDGKALFPSLVGENKRKASPLFGALDLQRAAVMGHSMGGGNSLRVLAENPGYRCGVALAPWDGKGFITNFNYPPKYGPKIRQPFLILHGEGDSRLDWKQTAFRWFQSATKVRGLSAFWLLDKNCDHKNVARLLSSSTKTDKEVFSKILGFAGAWLKRFLGDKAPELEAVLGPKLASGKYLRQLRLRVGAPEFWISGTGRLGAPLGFRLLGEPGMGVLFFAAKTGKLQTPWGTLLLDPRTMHPLAAKFLGASRIFALDQTIPKDPSLVGLGIPFQGLSLSSILGLQWSGLQRLQIKK